MSVENLSAVFIISNLLVAPFYVLMVFWPAAAITQRVMRSLWSVAAPALLTLGFGLTFLFSDAALASRFGSLLVSAAGQSGFGIYLQIIQELPPAALVMWLHAVAADVVMARWAYLESRELKLRTWPVSVAILLMCTNGPLGFVVYWGIRRFSISRRETNPAV
jgi:hypothetical protein